MQENEFPYNPPTKYVKVDPHRAKRIAQAYEEMKHDPHHPLVKAAYEALAHETMAQYHHAKKHGFRAEFWDPATERDPYEASPRLATEDVRHNNHMYVFPTDFGYGDDPISDKDIAENPLLAHSGEHWHGKPVRVNDIFRAVHDYYGHAKEGVGFRHDGEENAWRSHAAMFTPLARAALTTETRGQNSWLNFGPHGEHNRKARTEDTRFADQKIGLLPDWAMTEGAEDFGHARPKRNTGGALGGEDHPAWIPQRLPTGKKASSNPNDRPLIDLAALKEDPKLYAKNVALLRSYPNMPEHIAQHGSDDEVAHHFIGHVVDNLLALHDAVPEKIRNRSRKWYDGARKITDRWSQQYGLPDHSIAGALAALSPQKDWYQNVSLAHRLLEQHRGNGGEFYRSQKYTPEMGEFFHRLDKNGKPNALNKPEYQELHAMLQGKSLYDLAQLGMTPEATAHAQALWSRLYDEAHTERGHRLVTPEGDYGDYVKTQNGADAKVGWGSLGEIAKAIHSIHSPHDPGMLSKLMGARHKVRNFFNNILSPNSKHGDVTIDTHAVAAALMRPLAGNHLEVSHNFGNHPGVGLPAAGGSAVTGVQGLYPLYAEAYRHAAKMRNILPREMQSIAWEAVRGLFTDTFKSAKKNGEHIDNIWRAYRSGKYDQATARQHVFDYAGGIAHPSWAVDGSDPAHGAPARPANPGKFYSPAVSRASADLPVGGTGRGASPGVSSVQDPVVNAIRVAKQLKG